MVFQLLLNKSTSEHHGSLASPNVTTEPQCYDLANILVPSIHPTRKQQRAIDITEAENAIDVCNLSSGSSGALDAEPAVYLRRRDQTVERPWRTEGATWVSHPHLGVEPQA